VAVSAQVLVFGVEGVVFIWLSSTAVHLQTLINHKLGFNRNHHPFILILPIKIVLCSKFAQLQLISYKCFDMRLRDDARGRHLHVVA